MFLKEEELLSKIEFYENNINNLDNSSIILHSKLILEFNNLKELLYETVTLIKEKDEYIKKISEEYLKKEINYREMLKIEEEKIKEKEELFKNELIKLQYDRKLEIERIKCDLEKEKNLIISNFNNEIRKLKISNTLKQKKLEKNNGDKNEC